MTTQPELGRIDPEAQITITLGAIEVLVDLCLENELRSDADARLPVLHECLHAAAQRLHTA
jgi:hypothetical protein